MTGFAIKKLEAENASVTDGSTGIKTIAKIFIFPVKEERFWSGDSNEDMPWNEMWGFFRLK